MSPPTGDGDGARAGKESLHVGAMASAPSVLCGGGSVILAEVVPAGGTNAGETSEPNFDECVFNAKLLAVVDVTANCGAISGLDKWGARAKDGGRRIERARRGSREGVWVSGTKLIKNAMAASPSARGVSSSGASIQGASDPLAGSDRNRSGLSSIEPRPRSP